MPAKPLWYAGLSDAVFQKIDRWHTHYERGRISATRKLWADTGVVDFPVRYAVEIFWTQREVDYLAEVVCWGLPASSLAEDVRKIAANLKRSRQYPGGLYGSLLDFPKADVKQMLDALNRVRSRDSAREVADVIKSQKGGGLWKSES